MNGFIVQREKHLACEDDARCERIEQAPMPVEQTVMIMKVVVEMSS